MTFTTDNVRDKLRDTASSNLLLNSEEYTTSEISDAMDQAVSYWNSLSPLVSSLQYTVATVPSEYSEMFIKCTIGILLADRVPFLSRNRDLGAGNAPDASYESRVQEYKQIGDQYIKLFYEWAAGAKNALYNKLLMTG